MGDLVDASVDGRTTLEFVLAYDRKRRKGELAMVISPEYTSIYKVLEALNMLDKALYKFHLFEQKMTTFESEILK